jgi:hypothetical protein
MAAPSNPGDKPPAGQAGGGQAPQEIRLRVDERNIRTSYANVALTHATPEEVMIDFGLNLGARPASPGGQPEVTLQTGERIILSYYTAKKLAVQLGQLVRQYESQFGELELDAAKRRRTTG